MGSVELSNLDGSAEETHPLQAQENTKKPPKLNWDEADKILCNNEFKKKVPVWSSCMIVNIIVAIISLTILVMFWFTNIYNRLLLEKIILRNGSEIFDFWEKPPFDLILKVYVFNYTNFAEVLSGADVLIKVEEIGPYVYRERVEKTRMKIDDHTITFNENRSYIFIPELSNGLSEEDVLNVPNIPLISVIPNIKSLGFMGGLGLKAVLDWSKPKEFHNLTVLQYFFGYTDDFVSLVEKINWDFRSEDVGILATRRALNRKSVTVYDGTGNIDDVGKISAVANKNKLTIWRTDRCNQVTGSDGNIFSPSLVQHKEALEVYMQSFCRSLPLVFDEETKAHNGMRSYLYKAPFGAFSSRDSYPENNFYCELKGLNEQHVDGILDVSGCIDGNPPISISHPHFMEGNRDLFKHFEGLEPDISLHSTFAYVHPRLGIPLYGVSRLQVNLKLNRFGSYFKNVTDGIILPLAWIETAPEEFPDYIKTRVFISTVIVDFIEDIFKFGSVISLCGSIMYLTFKYTIHPKEN